MAEEKKIKYRDIAKLEPKHSADSLNISGETRWKTLVHNGVKFPDPYTPLPKGISVLYDGKTVELDSKNTNNPFNISAQEGAMLYASALEVDERKENKIPKDKDYNKNFWKDWQVILGKNHVIKKFSSLDFSPLVKYIRDTKEKKDEAKYTKSPAEKKEEKEQKKEMQDIYGYALVDGVLLPVGAYTAQPPMLYKPHGTHPKRGCIKKRLKPSDITLNCSLNSVPRCMENKKTCVWGGLVEDHDVQWIATWKIPITGKPGYIYLKREASHWVHSEDAKKFEKARALGKNIGKVREQYTKDLTSNSATKRQLATAVYLLDKLAIRPGTEKDETKEADTLGLTTLRVNCIQFGENKGSPSVTLDFFGKSSMKFVKTFKVEEKVYRNLRELCQDKSPKDEIFDKVDATSLNAYLKELLPDLTAKVFRTYKASSILQKVLFEKLPNITDNITTKKLLYDSVNIKVAKELNHQKLGTSDKQIEKLEAKISEYKGKKKSASESKAKTIDQSIMKAEMKLQEAKYNISTSTSKVNYLDPRITVSWCKLIEMPIEKIYSKTNLARFDWAMNTDSKWRF